MDSNTIKPSADIKVKDSATKEAFNRHLLLILQEVHKMLTPLAANCSCKGKTRGCRYGEETLKDCGAAPRRLLSEQS